MAEYELGPDALPAHLLNRMNKELEAQIRFYEEECEKAVREVDEHKDRLKFMFDHLGNVKAEIINTQALFDAKRREIETEDHLVQLAERERGRLKQRIEQTEVKRAELQERLDALQDRVFKGNLRMDEFKASMNFNQEELEQWDLARKQKEDDAAVLAKYAKEDEVKLKGLNLQIEKLSKEVQTRKQDLDHEITETRSAQIELDKTAEDYKELHKERQYLLQQWEEAVKAMHKRDHDIKAAGERYAEGKEWLEKRRKQLKARAEFHQIEVTNNRELDSKISQEERVLAKYRGDQAVLAKNLSDLEDEIEVVRNTLSKATKDKSSLTVEKQQLQQTLALRQQQYQAAQDSHDAVIKKLEDEVKAAADLDQQNKVVSNLLAETEQSMKALDKEVSRIKDEQYQNSQQLFNVRRQQANFLAEISGAQAQGRNMAAKIAQLDAESFKQQELLYNIEFNIQQMERKVNRAKGERTEEEKRELQEKIEMLQKMYDDLLKQHKVLDTQVKRVADDLRQSKYDNVGLEKEKKRVTEELLELTLENESCQLELSRMTKVKEEQLVHGDVLKLQVESMKKLLNRRDEELLGLENRQQQLAITVNEREAEIRVHHEVLKMECKTADEDRRRVSAELVERQTQVGHLKNRYQVLVGRMAAGQGEMTHAQHIVRTAKEREELQAKGDSLDAAIKKAERESRKLDKTIATLKGSNAKFKHQFTKVGEGDDELMQQKILQQKNKELQTIINRRTNEMKDFLRTEMSKMSELQDRGREKEEIQEKVRILEERKSALMRDIEEQKELVARYDLAVNKIRRTTEEEIAVDIQLQEEREKLDSLVQLFVSSCSSRGEEIARVAEGALLRHNIELPANADGGAAEAGDE